MFASPHRVLIRCAAKGLFESMPISCPDCAAPMPDTASFCPGCGRAMRPMEPARARGTVGALPEKLAGALAYFLLPAIVFLLVEPYNKNRFVRFHSFQCLGLCLAGLVVGAMLRVVGVAVFFIPRLAPLLLLLVSMMVGLAFLVVWVVLIVKASQGEMFKLPLVGHFAASHTSAS
jgi:uncharacterized membrane protein